PAHNVMNLLAVLVAAAALTGAAGAAPLNKVATFNITKAGRNVNYLAAVKHVAGRTGRTVVLPAGDIDVDLERRAGSASLTNDENFLWNAPVYIGNAQAFSLDLDTGSADTWVRGSSCTSSDGSCGVSGQAKFSTSDSTVTATGTSFSVSYGSGSVSGKVYLGPVELGGLTATVDFGVSTSETGFSDSDGLLGLGYSSISNIAAEGFTKSNFIDQLGLSTNEFSFYLSNYADSDSGEVTIGGVDTSKYTGSFSYISLSSETYWEASWSGGTYAVSTSTGKLDSSVKNFIVDTGTTLIYLDTTAANAINSAIGATYSSSYGAYVISCSKASTGPAVNLTIGGNVYSIPANIYVLQDGSICFSGFDRGATSIGLGILGDIFIRAYYT
ncbi:hypothetical protein HK405_001164, partial [Cladochytrium tenue]